MGCVAWTGPKQWIDLGSSNSSHFDGSWVMAGFLISNSLSNIGVSIELLAILLWEKEVISSAWVRGIPLTSKAVLKKTSFLDNLILLAKLFNY